MGIRAVLTLVFLLIVVPAYAPPTPNIPQQQGPGQRMEDQMRGAGQLIIPHFDYNHLIQPQFLIEPVGPPDERALNAGLGNGGDSYFCSGRDEANAYRALSGVATYQEYYRPNLVEPTNKGTYQFFKIEDRCRTVGAGCGGVNNDGYITTVGVPTHATNCHPWAGRRAWDDLIYENPPPLSQGAQTPFHRDYSVWAGRNYVEDNNAFLFGRYLFRRFPKEILHPNREVNPAHPGIGLGASFDGSWSYIRFHVNRPFLDIPYSMDHLQWGFICPHNSRNGAYGSNGMFVPMFRGGYTGEWSMETERRDHYKTLLALARNDLGRKISDNAYGNLAGSNPGPRIREMSEIVANVYNILDRLMPWLEGSCGGQGCYLSWYRRVLAGTGFIEMKCCPVAKGALVEYQHDEDRICLSPEVCSDCQSKRALNSDPHYNVMGRDPGSHCAPSYGIRREGGIYETLYGSTQGHELYLTGSGSNRHIESRSDGYVPADGYSPVIVSLIAHELVHAYFQRRGETRMKDWPQTPESLWEEELAVMAQALVYSHLADLGYAPTNPGSDSFGMVKRSFVRSVAHQGSGSSRRISGTTTGFRFAFPRECRGYGGIFLGPFCNNMLAIYQVLKEQQDPELARFMSHYHAMGPLLDAPGLMTVDGVESPFAWRHRHHEDDGRQPTQPGQIQRGTTPEVEMRIQWPEGIRR